MTGWPSAEVAREPLGKEQIALEKATQQNASLADDVEQTKTWVNLFKDNRKVNNAAPLQQYEHKGDRLKFDFDNIDIVEHSIGFCLVGCFMGRHIASNNQ